jgi:hypothetical protein
MILVVIQWGCDKSKLSKTLEVPASDGLQYPHINQKYGAGEPISFAVIGDFGVDGTAEENVSRLVQSWNPDFIITLGDNNYPQGELETIDRNIGKFYHQYIYNYSGIYGNGSPTMQFFPSLGNHDWSCKGCESDPIPYRKYFPLYGNGRYYDFIRGSVHFFALDSDSKEPDGTNIGSIQSEWLRTKLLKSTSPFKIVYFHHAPFSSGNSKGTPRMRWPFKKWGVSCVLSGHDHHYERFNVDGIPYIVNGVGGQFLYPVNLTSEDSNLRRFIDNQHFGAMNIDVDKSKMVIKYYSLNNELLDKVVTTSGTN